MVYNFDSRPDVEIDYNGPYDLKMTVADIEQNYTVYREITLTIADEDNSQYHVKLEVSDRYHDGYMPAHMPDKPSNGDSEDFSTIEHFDKANLADLSNVQAGDTEREKLKKPLIEWHENNPPDFNVN